MHKIGQISLGSYKKYCYALRELLRMAEEDYLVNKLQSLDKDSTIGAPGKFLIVC